MSGQHVGVSIARDDGLVERYQVEYEDNLTVFRVLNKIYQFQDRTIGYRHFCCKIGKCTSCLVRVNGKVVQGCKELVAPGSDLRLEAADADRVIRDLAIDFEKEPPRNQPVRSIEL